MMDFRRVDIAKQKAYDLLRDWIKLVARHTNPDQDISELLGWLWKLKPAPQPDPITGLVPCGKHAENQTRPADVRDACERLRWIFTQAEFHGVRVDDDDRKALRRACAAMERIDKPIGFDSIRQGG